MQGCQTLGAPPGWCTHTVRTKQLLQSAGCILFHICIISLRVNQPNGLQKARTDLTGYICS